MTPQPVWPGPPSELVLWAEVICIGIIASYAIAPKRREGGARGLLGFERWALLAATTMAGLSGYMLPASGSSITARLCLMALLVVLVTTLSVGPRTFGTHLERGTALWWDIVSITTFVIASAATIGLSRIGAAPTDSVVRSGKVAAVFCVVSAVVLVLPCGTYIVRGVLDRANAFPRKPSQGEDASADETVNVTEFNRGRSIGNIERLLMVMVIALGSYEALGFLVAAKGLIRAPEFEDRDFAEYFILGSLTSAGVALVVGTLLRVGVPYFWHLPN
jgi:hypothetical protein